MKLVNLTGQTFGRLVVVGRAASHSGGHVQWACLCNCGVAIAVRGTSLRRGDTASCGCLKADAIVARCRTHGQSGTHIYRMWHWAKHRAKVAGLSFNIYRSDICIPDRCPVLGIKLSVRSDGKSRAMPSSPTIDRLDPKLGYVRGNVWVISYRANTIKNGHSLKDLEAVVVAVKRQQALHAALGTSVEGSPQAASGIAS